MAKHYVYSPKYAVDFGPGHPFPTEKFRLLYEHALAGGLLREEQVCRPEPVAREALMLVHTAHYLDRLEKLIESGLGMVINGENPVNREIIDFANLCCGGSYLAGRLALEGGMGFHLGGGFHHAFPEHEEGFCYFNDIAVAIRMLQREGKLKRALVVDCDVHQGNGTAVIFGGDDSVVTASIHQEDNYPVKQESDADVSLLGAGADDAAYLAGLESLLAAAGEKGPYDLLFYVAGADPYERDRLGGFRVTMEGLRARDERVVGFCRERGMPLAVTLAGGYAEDVADVIAIHANTMRAARSLLPPA